MTTDPTFISPLPGTTMQLGEQKVKILTILDQEDALVEFFETGRKQVAALRDLRIITRPAESTNTQESNRHIHPDEDTDALAIAEQRFSIIRPLLGLSDRNTIMVKNRANEFNLHWTTLYEWLRFYENTGLLSSLMPRKRGPRKGLRRISEEQEAIVENAIKKKGLSSQRHKVSEVCKLVERQCHVANIKPPHPNTVRARIDEIHPKELLQKRGRRDLARDRHQAIRGHFPTTSYPLEVVQMDHTKADIILLDDQRLTPLGRPFLTVALDIHTRMIVGLVVQFEAPGAATAGTCISSAMLPKDNLLKAVGVDGTWPVWGKIGTLHMDNAREFKGEVLKQACAEYGIDLQLRPIKTPHYGGHIERYMGTLASTLRNLSGATFSNIAERKGYNAEAKATMTLREFESWLIDWIVNVYHQTPHSALGISPAKAWSNAWNSPDEDGKARIPAIPADPERLRLDFLPFYKRTVQRYGIVLDDIYYWDEILAPYVNMTETPRSKKKIHFLIRRDPWHLKTIWFLHPETRLYHEIPTRDIRRPDVSIWEWRVAQKHLREERAVNRDESAIFETLDRLQAREEEAARNTKAARRRSKQSKTSVALPNHKIVNSSSATSLNTPTNSEKEDIFATPVVPFGMNETSS